ncbi:MULTISPECIES: GNAT family N-acetyltransferase [Acinetobacter]|uniref:GNAT family N-acetyltransferase n=1 Tax=Acinetobacter TaxID=469 RepID=UPI001D193C3E|nr:MULTISPECIES: GNAT family protein [Acinetobacter]
MNHDLQNNMKNRNQNQGIAIVGALVKPLDLIEPNFSSLQGRTVKLQLLSTNTLSPIQHQQIWQVVQSESDVAWTYMAYTGFAQQTALINMLDANFHLPDAIHFGIETRQGVVGWVGLLNIRPVHRVIEIGNVYFSHQMKRSTAATEVLYLLLKHCFAQGYRRVEWKCDDLNVPSKKAALRFGFQYEGTFRQDRIVKGRNRDTAWFSMIDTDWPLVQQAYEAWLADTNFDEHGRQKLSLAQLMPKP